MLNRSHPVHQLVRMFDTIDGHRTIGEIVERANGDAAGARILFERLWRYDQVVFDTTNATGRAPVTT